MRTRAGILLVSLWIAACTAPAGPGTDPISRYGLEATVLGQTVLSDAIALANEIMGTAGSSQFVGGWDESRTQAHTTPRVPVYAVASRGLSKTDLLLVPEGCGCVFFQAPAFREWLKPYAAEGGGTAISAEHILAFMLLHELGHIANGDYGGFGDLASAPSGPLNINATAQKERERAADRYAADLIRAAFNQRDRAKAMMDAGFVSMNLGNLSFNLLRIRLVDHFGASALGAREVFWDTGYTHPNIELRVLQVNYLIAQTPQALKLLQEFEASRQKPRPPILFDARTFVPVPSRR